MRPAQSFPVNVQPLAIARALTADATPRTRIPFAPAIR